MKNEIEEIRKDTRKYFDPTNLIRTPQRDNSESTKFYYEMSHYLQTDENRNWIVSNIEIFNRDSSELDFQFLANSEDVIYHSLWVTVEGIEYLFLPEAMGGQSVYDTKNKTLHSFYSEKEPFIWLDLVPSPDRTKLAVEGCYWACPTELRIFDISQITSLPYPLIHQESKGNQTELVWETNNCLKIIGSNSESAVKV